MPLREVPPADDRQQRRCLRTGIENGRADTELRACKLNQRMRDHALEATVIESRIDPVIEGRPARSRSAPLTKIVQC